MTDPTNDQERLQLLRGAADGALATLGPLHRTAVKLILGVVFDLVASILDRLDHLEGKCQSRH